MLQIGVIFLYINAVFALLGLLGSIGAALFALIYLAFTVAYGFAGLGIANEKRSGYRVGLAVSAFNVVLSLVFLVMYQSFTTLLSMVLAVALLALLAHPESRGYTRLWFH